MPKNPSDIPGENAPSPETGVRSARSTRQTRHDLYGPDVSVVIVNYNVREFLAQALQSVERASANLDVETIVIDNNSIDGSVHMLRSEFPDVTVISNAENVGFGRANNMGIRRATGRHILILNPDTIVQEDTLDTLSAWLDDHPECGAVGCQILNPDGSFAPESRRSFPTPEIAFYRMTGLSRLFPGSRIFGRYNLSHIPVDRTIEVDALSGSCMMVRRAALLGDSAANDLFGPDRQPAGLFDEQFFMYGEDLDLCYRIKEAGWTIMYVPETQIIHYKGESTKKGEIRYVRLFYGAMLLFIEKHLNTRRSGGLSLMLRAGIFLRATLTVAATWLRRLRWPMFDIAVVYAVVTSIGWLRSAASDAELAPLFYLTVAPAYALATAGGVSLAGGYRQAYLFSVRPALVGTGIGFLVVATLSFFFQSIAFSRAVIAISLPVAAGMLVVWRFVASMRRHGPRRAILVGCRAEAHRLRRMLAAHPNAPFRLEGYVTVEATATSDGTMDPVGGEDDAPLRLGRVSHLRDLVRLKGFDDIVFAAKSVSNQTIFDTMRTLRDLNVQFRTLSEGKEHVIGKSSVSHVSVASLLSGMPELVVLRSRFSTSLFDYAVSLLLMPLIPATWIARTAYGPASAAARLYERVRRLPSVWTRGWTLIGARPEHLDLIPEAWSLRPGVFPVTNTYGGEELDSEDVLRAYWYYVTHQSSALDWELIARSLLRP